VYGFTQEDTGLELPPLDWFKADIIFNMLHQNIVFTVSVSACSFIFYSPFLLCKSNSETTFVVESMIRNTKATQHMPLLLYTFLSIMAVDND